MAAARRIAGGLVKKALFDTDTGSDIDDAAGLALRWKPANRPWGNGESGRPIAATVDADAFFAQYLRAVSA